MVCSLLVWAKFVVLAAFIAGLSELPLATFPMTSVTVLVWGVAGLAPLLLHRAPPVLSVAAGEFAPSGALGRRFVSPPFHFGSPVYLRSMPSTAPRRLRPGVNKVSTLKSSRKGSGFLRFHIKVRLLKVPVP